MEPRRTKSSKFTDLPRDYSKQVVSALNQSFPDELKSGRFVVEGRIYPDEILMRVGYLEKGRLKQANFETSIGYRAGKDNVLKLLNLAADVSGTMLEEFFSSVDDSDFPRIWTPYEVDGVEVYLQFSGTNSELERKADELLGQSPTSFLTSPDEETSPEAIKAQLGIDPDEDLDANESAGDNTDDGTPTVH